PDRAFLYGRNTPMNETPKTLTAYSFSLLIALLSGAQPNCCFKDAWQAFINLPQWFLSGRYVVGWVVLVIECEAGFIEHAWCLLADGTIVDPAIVLLVGPEVTVQYFTGIEYTRSQALSFEDELLPRVRFTRYGDDGMGHPDYKAAHSSALTLAQDRAAV